MSERVRARLIVLGMILALLLAAGWALSNRYVEAHCTDRGRPGSVNCLILDRWTGETEPHSY